ncbi:MAG: hypothetical protein WCF65_06180 [Parachlamydiaceae bacterium]
MFKWLTSYNKSTTQTKYFVLNWLIYGLALIITTIYCYARMDFVRSYRTPGIVETHQTTQQTKQ